MTNILNSISPIKFLKEKYYYYKPITLRAKNYKH